MKTRYIFLLIVSAAAAAAFLPRDARGQNSAAGPAQGVLGVLQHGNWECALPGDAGTTAFVVLPDESFRIGTASSYSSAAGTGIYLMRGNEVVFTRGPKKDQRFRRLGDNTLQKLNPDGSPSKIICTRLGGSG
ncbi:MAG: elongation factor P [Erythrobacter sp.]|nr:elongation factor P [Erythrobacter sp.]